MNYYEVRARVGEGFRVIASDQTMFTRKLSNIYFDSYKHVLTCNHDLPMYTYIHYIVSILLE